MSDCDDFAALNLLEMKFIFISTLYRNYIKMKIDIMNACMFDVFLSHLTCFLSFPLSYA